MTNEQIIKAADICRTGECSGCPYHELYTASCLNKLTKDVYHLLNRQKAEIERLKAENKSIRYCYEQAKSYNDTLAESCEKNCKHFNMTTRAEAIIDFAERLKKTSIGLEVGDDKKFKMTVVSTIAIDNLVKEMTEG